MTELLAPAGNLEKLIYAEKFGADAVYFGLKSYSLRNFAGNFTLEEAASGLSHLHASGKKGYAALNIFPFQDEYDDLIATAGALDELGVDGLIVSDIGVIAAMKASGIRAPLHVSTQANTLSPQTISVLSRLGAARVNLARELSLERISRLMPEISRLGVETEVFIHGSVCFSYSGRCAISDYLTGRRANRGECTHPCRWQYSLVEEKRPGQFMPVFEDERGTYFFNTKDLALFQFVPQLKSLGIDSFKLEGRMKSVNYVAQTVSLYRRLLDGEKIDESECLRLLGRVKNRGYSTGFIKGDGCPNDLRQEKSTPTSLAIFIGTIEDQSEIVGSRMNLRNKAFAGEKVEILKTDGSIEIQYLPDPLVDVEGNFHSHASHGTVLALPFSLPAYSIVRRISHASI